MSRRLQETCCHSDSSGKLSANTGVKNSCDNVLFGQLYDFKYSYLILITYKQFYLIHRWDPNKHYHSRSESNDNKNVTTLLRAPELEPYHQMQFVMRDSFEDALSLCGYWN